MMRLAWADDDKHYIYATSQQTSQHKKHSHEKRQKFKKTTKIMYYWTRKVGGGGVGTFGCHCVRTGGTQKFFQFFGNILAVMPSIPAKTPKNYQKFGKIFVSPPRCEHSNNQMSFPPVACPVRHLFTTMFFYFTYVLRINSTSDFAGRWYSPDQTKQTLNGVLTRQHRPWVVP